MKSFKNYLLNFLTYLPYKKFELACKNSEQSFENNWQSTKKLLLKKNQFWIKKGRSSDSKLDDFDITNYSYYEDAMLQSMDSSISELNGEKVLFSPMTSGTNGAMKPFLITKSYKKQYQIVTPPFIHSMTTHVDLGLGKFIYLISLDSAGFLKANVPTGTIGNFTYKSLPKLFRLFYALPSNILKNPNMFKEYSPYYCLSTEVSALFSVTPPIAINFLKNVLDDLKVKIHKILDPKFQMELGIRLSSKREAHLKKILNKDQILVTDIWPTLQIVSCWTTAVCELSIPELQKLVTSSVKIVDGFYSATEGWVTVQTNLTQRGCVYHPNGCLLEFIECGLPILKENLVKPWNLEMGKTYEVFFTNLMGLIRYRIGDIVKCNGFFYSSPILEFVGKSASAISLGIIRLSENEITKAAKLAKLEDLNNNFFVSFTPEGHGLGFYLNAKFEMEDKKLLALVFGFDQELMKLSKDYSKERSNGTVLGIRVYRVQGEVEYFVTDSTGQKKPKVIVNDLNFIKESNFIELV